MSRVENKCKSLLEVAATVLLETGADVNMAGGTRERNTGVVIVMILLTAERGDIECAQALINAGADVNFCLQMAALMGKSRCIQTLAKLPEADVNATLGCNVSVLMMAAWEGKLECGRILIEAGADVNHVDSMGHTALMWAVRFAHSEFVSVLIEAGADINLFDEDGNTALIWAARLGIMKSVRLLTEAGANVNTVNKNGETALSVAKYECVKDLLSAGADVNMVPDRCFTFLLRAVDEKDEECVRLLTEVGASVNERKTMVLPLLMGATVRFLFGIVRLLLKAGIEVNQWRKVNNCKVNTLGMFIGQTGERFKSVNRLLMAAGETAALSPFVPDYLWECLDSLKSLCRYVIRTNMVNAGRVNLFVRVPQFCPKIPKELVEYLLFNISVDDPVGDDPADNSNVRPFSLFPKNENYEASNEDVLLDVCEKELVLLNVSEEELQRIYDHFGSDVSNDLVRDAPMLRKPGRGFLRF